MAKRIGAKPTQIDLILSRKILYEFLVSYSRGMKGTMLEIRWISIVIRIEKFFRGVILRILRNQALMETNFLKKIRGKL